MQKLISITAREYLNNEYEYPTVCYIVDEDIIRYTPPVGYQILDMSDNMYKCSDGDFYLRK